LNERGPRVLVVDDEALFRATFAALLKSSGCRVEVAAGCDEALERIHASLPFDAVIVDFEMPRRSGLELLAELSGAPARPLVHVVSAYVTPSEALAGSVWTKPVDLERLVPAVVSGAGARPDCAFVAFVGAASGRSGRLDIQCDHGRGSIWIGQGRILGARAEGRDRSLRGLRAVLALLDRTDPCVVRVVPRGEGPQWQDAEAVDESLPQVVFTLKAYRARHPRPDPKPEP